MKYLSAPTAKLPNKRLIVEENFIRDLVEAVNQLNDFATSLHQSVEAIKREISDVDQQNKAATIREREAREQACAKLSEDVAKTNAAVKKIAEATDILLGGD